MDAKYMVEMTEMIIEFKAKPLDYSKCLQIKRIAEAGKKWKGYNLSKIEFGSNGLHFIHIIRQTPLNTQ